MEKIKVYTFVRKKNPLVRPTDTHRRGYAEAFDWDRAICGSEIGPTQKRKEGKKFDRRMNKEKFFCCLVSFFVCDFSSSIFSHRKKNKPSKSKAKTSPRTMALLGCVSCSFPLSLFHRRFSIHSERVQAAFFSLLFCFPSCFPLHTQYRLFDAVLLLRCVYALKCMDGFFFFSSSASLHSIHTLLFFSTLCDANTNTMQRRKPHPMAIGLVGSIARVRYYWK